MNQRDEAAPEAMRQRDDTALQTEDADVGAVGDAMEESVVPFLAVHRDPVDIRTILSLTWSSGLLVLLLLMSLSFNIYQYWRRPDRIVVDRSSGRVLVINDREYGATEAVSLAPERLTNDDKKYIAGEFIKAIYQIDPVTRKKDVERALKMMSPNSALVFAQYLKRNGVLDKQLAESMQAVWTQQDIALDQADPYIVRVIGKQEITKMVAGVARTETRQLSLTLKLVADPLRRADRNLRSGFLVAKFDDKELGGAAGAEVSANK
jgi:hypothetical protein